MELDDDSRRARRSIALTTGLEPPRSGVDLRRRFSTWWWPATQMSMGAALAWFLADRLLASPGGYAPITAIVAMGLGRERRLWRSVVLVGGLLLGTAVAELAGAVFGIGWWQVGLILGASGLLAGLLFNKELAVTYATINAVVLHGLPGDEGWVPTRLLDGLIGVVAALVVTFGIAPSRPYRQLADRLSAVADRAVDGLETAARELRRAPAERRRRAAGDASSRIDDELQRVSGTVDHSLDLVRWAPIRRRSRDEVERLVASSWPLAVALTTASTVVRLCDRAVANDVVVHEELLHGVERAASAIRGLTTAIIDARPPDEPVADECRSVLDSVLSEPADRAVVIAIQEEVRGLLDDLIVIADDLTPGNPTPLEDAAATRSATVGQIRFGGAARERDESTGNLDGP
jgi:uncharacterized membrane protein YgaE (UPF0421/DUF939 family)